MRGIDRIAAKHWIICADLFADLGNQFIQLTLLDVLIFRGERALSNLVFMCLLEQTPSILLSPFAGLWIDRLGGRKWLIMVNMGKCLLVGLLVFTSSPWVIFPAYLCLVIGSLFFNIGRLSFAPLLMPKEALISFNALNERVSLAGRIFGPCVIGWIVLNTGQGVALTAAGLLFAISAGCIHWLPKIRQVSLERTDSSKKHDGLRPLLSAYREPFETNHHLKVYFLIFGFVLMGGGVLNLGLPIFFKTGFGGTIAHWGLIMSGFQAGACLATFLLPRCSSSFSHQNLLSFTFLILAGAMAILGHLTTYLQIAFLMIIFGCGFTFMHILLESLIQQNSPRAYMAKTISLLSTYRGGCYLTTVFCSALVLKIWNPQFLLLVGSVVMVSASVLVKKTMSSPVFRTDQCPDPQTPAIG